MQEEVYINIDDETVLQLIHERIKMREPKIRELLDWVVSEENGIEGFVLIVKSKKPIPNNFNPDPTLMELSFGDSETILGMLGHLAERFMDMLGSVGIFGDAKNG